MCGSSPRLYILFAFSKKARFTIPMACGNVSSHFLTELSKTWDLGEYPVCLGTQRQTHLEESLPRL